MADSARTSGDARRKITHDQLLAVAARQINRKGVAAKVLKDVADELGVTRMALYRYVDDREDLVFQSYRRTCDVLAAHLAAATAASDDACEAAAGLIRRVLAPGEPELCAVTESGLLPPDRRAEVGERFDAVVGALAAVLTRGMAAGQVRTCDAEIAARGILGVIFWVPVSDLWNTAKYDDDRARAVEVAIDFVLRGWAADRSAPPVYAPFDISDLAGPAVEAFDRDALAEAKRERILAIASRLFNEKGVDSTTLDDVAGELGATSGAISHHVGDKPTLAAECYVRTLRMAIRLQDRANALPGPRIVAQAAFQHAWSLAQMRHWPLMPLTGFEALPPAGQRAFQDLVGDLADSTSRHIEAGAADGSMRRLPRYAMRVQSGVIGWLARSGIRDPARQDAVAREVAALVAMGIRPLGAL